MKEREQIFCHALLIGSCFQIPLNNQPVMTLFREKIGNISFFKKLV